MCVVLIWFVPDSRLTGVFWFVFTFIMCVACIGSYSKITVLGLTLDFGLGFRLGLWGLGLVLCLGLVLGLGLGFGFGFVLGLGLELGLGLRFGLRLGLRFGIGPWP